MKADDPIRGASAAAPIAHEAVTATIASLSVAAPGHDQSPFEIRLLLDTARGPCVLKLSGAELMRMFDMANEAIARGPQRPT